MLHEGAMQVSKEEKQSTVFLNYNAYEPQQITTWHGNPKDLS